MLTQKKPESQSELSDDLLNFLEENSLKLKTQIQGPAMTFGKNYIIIFKGGEGFYFEISNLKNLTTELEEKLFTFVKQNQIFNQMDSIISIQTKFRMYLNNIGFTFEILSPEKKEELMKQIKSIKGQEALSNVQEGVRNEALGKVG